jgi:HSP20 family protein
MPPATAAPLIPVKAVTPPRPGLLRQVNAAPNISGEVLASSLVFQRHRSKAMPKTEITKPGETSLARPGDIFTAMRDEMDRVFGRFERDWPFPSLFGRDGRGAMLVPELDVRESTNSITIEAELPGVEEKDVSVTLVNGVLTIKGEKKQEKEEKSDSYHLTERSFGSFQRSLRLPDTVDDSKVEARFDKGVLKVTAAKRPDAVKAERRIEIKTA